MIRITIEIEGQTVIAEADTVPTEIQDRTGFDCDYNVEQRRCLAEQLDKILESMKVAARGLDG